MVSTHELKEALLLALAEQVGTYTFSNGLNVAAARIDDGSAPYPEEPQIAGLELVIVPQLEVSVTVLMGGYQDVYTTLITLKQWDIDKTTIPARGPVLQALAQFDSLNVGQMRRVIRSNKLDNIETLTIPVSETLYLPGEEF